MKRITFLTQDPPNIFRRGEKVCLTNETWHDIHLRHFEDTPKAKDVGVVRWCFSEGCMIDWGSRSNLNSNHLWPLKEIERAYPEAEFINEPPKAPSSMGDFEA